MKWLVDGIAKGLRKFNFWKRNEDQESKQAGKTIQVGKKKKLAPHCPGRVKGKNFQGSNMKLQKMVLRTFKRRDKNTKEMSDFQARGVLSNIWADFKARKAAEKKAREVAEAIAEMKDATLAI